MATFVVCQIYIFPSSKHEIMTKMTKNENNDSFMRDKNIMRAVDGKRKSHFAWPYILLQKSKQTSNTYKLKRATYLGLLRFGTIGFCIAFGPLIDFFISIYSELMNLLLSLLNQWHLCIITASI